MGKEMMIGVTEEEGRGAVTILKKCWASLSTTD
jgi:hypothetical protein